MPCLVVILIAGAAATIYYANKSSINKLTVNDIPETESVVFDETISNNFIQPNVSAKITGKVRTGSSVQPQYRDGVISLEINNDTLWLMINIGRKEGGEKVDYNSPTLISNSTESNLGRYKFSEGTYSEGYEGWQYFNDLNQTDCGNTKFCGSGLIEKDNDVIFNVVCSYQTNNNNVNDCDEIMRTLKIEVIN